MSDPTRYPGTSVVNQAVRTTIEFDIAETVGVFRGPRIATFPVVTICRYLGLSSFVSKKRHLKSHQVFNR